MSDTILQSNDVMDSRRGDIVVASAGPMNPSQPALGSWRSIADRTAGECGLRMDIHGYGIPAGR